MKEYQNILGKTTSQPDGLEVAQALYKQPEKSEKRRKPQQESNDLFGTPALRQRPEQRPSHGQRTLGVEVSRVRSIKIGTGRRGQTIAGVYLSDGQREYGEIKATKSAVAFPHWIDFKSEQAREETRHMVLKAAQDHLSDRQQAGGGCHV